MKPNVELHIDHLILEGFSRNDAHYIGESVKIELQRLIMDRGLPASFNSHTMNKNLTTPPLTIKNSSPPEQIGSQIAHSIYSGFTVNTNNR